ncbi:MAG: chorismate-binding protein, partial [Deltaproteobacteria bacterium]|nr:chorismate-binding protein [Deltaproteobacteria bacterium]
RALRRLSSAPHGVFIDFGAVPGAPDAQIAGVSHEPLHVRRRDGGPTMAAALDQALPHPSTTGTPPALAAKLIRRLEDTSRQIWGGAVGYLCPGGEAAFMLADELIMAAADHFWCTAGAALEAETDALALPAAVRRSARLPLAAIRAAQLATPG